MAKIREIRWSLFCASRGQCKVTIYNGDPPVKCGAVYAVRSLDRDGCRLFTCRVYCKEMPQTSYIDQRKTVRAAKAVCQRHYAAFQKAHKAV